MSPLLHFVDKQNVFLRFRGVPGKIIRFISWFRLKIIVVGRYTTRPDCRFTDSFTYILDLPKIWIKIISSRQEVLCKTCNFIKKETLAQVFSCEFCKTSKNTFSYRRRLLNNYSLSILILVSIFLSLKYLDQIIQVQG